MLNHTESLTALARLATATANYETAWRASLIARDDDRRLSSDRMQDAYRTQVEALNDVTAQVGPDLARAMHGALIAAACMVNGDRPSRYHNFTDVAGVRNFIRQTINGEAGV